LPACAELRWIGGGGGGASILALSAGSLDELGQEGGGGSVDAALGTGADISAGFRVTGLAGAVGAGTLADHGLLAGGKY
jgi:hypothetical protein